MINSYKKPEILAPCGSYDILIAAINAGADACYFGGNKFGARAYATNFDLETSLKAIDYAHIHGTSLYLTVNTLFKDNEIEELYQYILPYYEAGLDAVIVQDLGVFKYIKEMFPDIHIHCSTQMNITSKYAAKAMKELGASRIVTAREMSLKEIAEIKQEMDIEIESFVHGAMCYSYSGRCLMSSLAGGRSGNRGRCAQPCRKAYDGEYILSMKDMCTLSDVPKLIDAGIDSLKIEGRMKNEYYVASAVDAYNQIAQDYVEGCYSDKKAEGLRFKLANIYNRGGFCGGYYFMHNGPEMISKDRPNNQGIKLGKVVSAKDGEIGLKLYHSLYKQDVIEVNLNDGNVVEITSGINGDKNSEVKLKCPKTKLVALGQTVLRTRCNHIIEDIDNDIVKKTLKYHIFGEFKGEIGKELSLTVGRNINDKYYQATVVGDIVQEARGKAADVEDIRLKLSQLGNTCYIFEDLSINVDEDAFIPASAIKALRRQAITALEEKVCSESRRKAAAGDFVDSVGRIYHDSRSDEWAITPEINVGVTTIDHLNMLLDVDYVDNIFMSLELYKSSLKDFDFGIFRERGTNIILELPYIVKNHFNMTDYLPNEAINGIYVRNIDGLFAYVDYMQASEHNSSLRVICGDGVYSYNSYARQFIEALIPGVEFELPRELNRKELTSLGVRNNHLVVYEHQQVMLSAQCVVKNKLGCNKSNSLIKLRDDKKNGFYAQAVCGECCNVIYNGNPYMVLNQIDDDYINSLGIKALKFNLTVEDKTATKEILGIISEYTKGISPVNAMKATGRTYTSGHFNRGVE